MLKYLRIAVTALGLTACVLLVALWVRSYSLIDVAHGPLPGDRSFQAISCCGKLAVIVGPHKASWQYYTGTRREFWWRIDQYKRKRIGLFASLPRTYNRHEVTVSYILFLMLFAAIAWLPWVRWRFSLRTLLIATTLAAVGLGILVWSS
jgi:hypothetical protein